MTLVLLEKECMSIRLGFDIYVPWSWGIHMRLRKLHYWRALKVRMPRQPHFQPVWALTWWLTSVPCLLAVYVRIYQWFDTLKGVKWEHFPVIVMDKSTDNVVGACFKQAISTCRAVVNARHVVKNWMDVK